jgi:Glycosyl transferase family 2
VNACSEDNIASLPVFVISYNREPQMLQVIQSYRRQSWPVDIIVHENGSREPSTIAILENLESQGITVVRAATMTCRHG